MPEDQGLDITVTCDGTWARRGFQSLYDIVVIASLKTGKFLDVEDLSKHCQACATHHGMDTASDEYLDWWKANQASCDVNYCGSSSATELIGAFAIWKRSVSKNKLRYTQMISDGDSKTFKLLSNQLLYVVANLVSKYACVGHVQKRMVTVLKGKAKEKFVKERGESVRMRGKWRLTDQTIKLWTCYYGKAIRSNTSDCAAMQDAVWAVFYHSHSTDSSPQHQYCPIGQRSCGGSTVHLPFPSHPHPFHPPSFQILFALSYRSLIDLSSYTNGVLHTWSDSESERVIQ